MKKHSTITFEDAEKYIDEQSNDSYKKMMMPILVKIIIAKRSINLGFESKVIMFFFFRREMEARVIRT